MKTYLAITVLVLSVSTAFGQLKDRPLSVKKSWGSYKIYQEWEKYSHGKISDIMDEDSKAYAALHKASNANFGAQSLGAIGGFIIGYQIGGLSANPKREINLTNLLIGTGFIVGSIPLSRAYKKNTYKAVKLFNDSLDPSTPKPGIYKSSFIIRPTGIGLQIWF
jgi:hypothetical protein